MLEAADKIFLIGLAENMGIDPAVCAGPGTTLVPEESRRGTQTALLYRLDDSIAKHAFVRCDPDLVAVLNNLIDSSQPLNIDDFVAAAIPTGATAFGGSTEHILLHDLIAPHAPICRGHLVPLGDHGEHVVSKVSTLQSGCSVDDVQQSDFRLDDLDPFLIGWEHDGELLGLGGARYHEARAPLYDIGVLTHGDARTQGVGSFLVAAITGAVLAAGSIPLYRRDLENDRSHRVVKRLGFTEVMETKSLTWSKD